VYIGEGPERVFVRTFAVGLGEYDSTPVGRFRVRQSSKLINPEWVNPRTGQRFLTDDPANPIGERWIGLEGVSESVRDLGGYGIHGTIEPQTIGHQASMGCIRMLPDDIELVYELLVETLSTVEIVDGMR
jgi:lipoprotein-anchoring transpeptidase ErfK/SrfK